MVKRVEGTEPAERMDGRKGREGKVGGTETVATQTAAASQPRGEEPEGFGSSTFLLMSPFSCCNSERPCEGKTAQRGKGF